MRWNLGLKLPANPAGRNYPVFAREPLNPTTDPEENPSNLAHLPALAITSTASAFGGGDLPNSPVWKTRNCHVETNSTPISCGCQEEKSNILYFTSIWG